MSTLDRYNSATVRDIARIPGPASEELYRLASLGRKDWTLPDWNKMLDELDSCEQTVAEFREFRE